MWRAAFCATLFTGVVGSFVGSVVFSLIGFHAYGLVAELIVGVVGACLFIWLGKKALLTEEKRQNDSAGSNMLPALSLFSEERCR